MWTTPPIYPHLTFTPIVGVPTVGTIRTLTAEVYANTRAVYSAAGGGTNGHLGIAMPAAAYLARAGVAFILPTHPGEQEEPPAQASGPAVVALNRSYDQKVENYAIYANVRQKVKNQILQAVEATYLNVLKDPTFGFTDVTIKDFLAHLRTTYGTLDAIQLKCQSTIVPPTAPTVPALPVLNAAVASQVQCEGIPLFYCWSHGIGKNPNHTSSTCETKKAGHKNDATIMDRQSGFTYINFGVSGRPLRHRE
jgi:hypothetical protein